MPFYFLLLLFALYSCVSQAIGGTFSANCANNSFTMDGKPFLIIGGEIHYFRVHPDLWNDRLKRIQALGMNTIKTYVPWFLHEPYPGKYDFTGILDIVKFVKLAKENQFYVILSPGPYISTELDNGGLPWWLLKYDNIMLRGLDKNFLNAVSRFYGILLPLLKPLLYQNGGPILMAQVESEYGAYDCDQDYLVFLTNLFRRHLGNEAVLITAELMDYDKAICGSALNTATTFVITAINYTDYDQSLIKDTTIQCGLKFYSKLVVGGYLEWGWAEENNIATLNDDDNIFAYIKSTGGSFIIYMVHGGTNFEFTNGAHTAGPIATSHDFGAAISENGDITPTYKEMRAAIHNLTDSQQKPIPENNLAANYGSVPMKCIGNSLMEALNYLQETCKDSTYPLGFETVDHGYGYVLYTHFMKTNGSTLQADDIKDYGYVFVNNDYQGMLDNSGFTIVSLNNAKSGSVLRILVENRGRQSAPTIIDRKGLNNVTIDFVPVYDWITCGINLTRPSISKLLNKFSKSMRDVNESAFGPGIYVGEFEAQQFQDTFFDSTGWGKGQLFVNGFNLGRYWPVRGPQMTLYVPSPLIQCKNTVMLIELIGGQKSNANFINHTIYNFK